VFNRIEFVVGEALTALSRNRLMTLAAVTTVAVTLFVFGGLGYAYFRVNRYAQTIPGKFKMLVYLRDEATATDVQKAAAALRGLSGVASATWIPKDRAWDKWKLDHPSALTAGVENPLPEGFKVILKDLKQSDSVASDIRAMPIVAPEDGVMYLGPEQRFVDGLLTAFRWIGGVVGGVLFIIAGVLIYNTIRLTVLARRIEIRIMQLVGASRATVYVPFLIEGMLQGVIGAILATGLVVGAFFGFGWVMQNYVNFTYTPAQFPYVPVLGILCAGGAVYGILCSTLAIRAPLKYR